MFYTVIGTQWGDEGKGKIVDWLASKADVVVRFQGGNNAGHTLQIDNTTYKLNLLPSGIIRGKQCIIGNGVVLDLLALKEEIDKGDVCAVIIEPMQAEGGDKYATNRFFNGLRALTRYLNTNLIKTQSALDLTNEEVKTLIVNSFKSSFLDEVKKNEWIEKINK